MDYISQGNLIQMTLLGCCALYQENENIRYKIEEKIDKYISSKNLSRLFNINISINGISSLEVSKKINLKHENGKYYLLGLKISNKFQTIFEHKIQLPNELILKTFDYLKPNERDKIYEGFNRNTYYDMIYISDINNNKYKIKNFEHIYIDEEIDFSKINIESVKILSYTYEYNKYIKNFPNLKVVKSQISLSIINQNNFKVKNFESLIIDDDINYSKFNPKFVKEITSNSFITNFEKFSSLNKFKAENALNFIFSSKLKSLTIYSNIRNHNINDLTNLEELRYKFQNLNSEPLNFNKLKKLRKLEYYIDKYTNYQKENFMNLEELILRIDFESNFLLPLNLFPMSLTSLSLISIDEHQFAELPKLPNLKTLKLTSYEIKEIYNGIENLEINHESDYGRIGYYEDTHFLTRLPISLKTFILNSPEGHFDKIDLSYLTNLTDFKPNLLSVNKIIY
jgi:hypothetical protein